MIRSVAAFHPGLRAKSGGPGRRVRLDLPAKIDERLRSLAAMHRTTKSEIVREALGAFCESGGRGGSGLGKAPLRLVQSAPIAGSASRAGTPPPFAGQES